MFCKKQVAAVAGFSYNLKRTNMNTITRLLLLLTTILLSVQGSAQLTGTKSIPGDYASVALALADLNTQGVGTGGVIFNIGAGTTYTETAPAGGFCLGSALLNASLSAGNPLLFQKDATATANPVLTAFTGGTATPATGTLQDGIFRIKGCDYVTIDGIDLAENASNTTDPATMEYGYAMYKYSQTDGCQYNTIKNCVITLNRINNTAGTGAMLHGSVGILIINSKDSFPTSALVITTAAGTNSYNKLYSNVIQNCNTGIGINGNTASSAIACDNSNDVGGTGSATGNMILNFGGGAGATNGAYGIITISQRNLHVAYNNIDNNDGAGVNHPPANLFGISSTGGVYGTADITQNTISLKSNAVSQYVFGVSVSYLGAAYANITYNTITNSSANSMTTGTFYGINATGAVKVNINYNTIEGVTIGSSAATPQVYPQVYGIYSYSGTIVPDTVYANYNNIKNFTITCNSFAFMTGLSINAGKVHRAYNNTLNNFLIKGTGTGGTITGMLTANAYYSNSPQNSTVNYDGNTISNLSINQSGINPAGTINAMLNTYQSSYGISFANNKIHHLQANGAAAIYGINIYSGSTYNNNMSGNTMYAFNSNGGAVTGINFFYSGRLNCYKNKLYDFLSTGTNGTIKAINIGNTFDTCQFYNNYIGDLKTPIASNINRAVIGINVPFSSMGSKIKAYNNTIYLDAVSAGTNFSSAAFYHGANAASNVNALILKNNIIVNTSVANGSGLSIALERSVASLANYLDASNNNLLYAGVPSAQQLIYFDGTNSEQTLDAFKTRVGPAKETNSISFMPSFISTAGADDLYLHLNPVNNCETIGKGDNSTFLLAADYDGDTRLITSPYVIDIGADESVSNNQWTGINSSNWNDAGNWSKAIVPNDIYWAVNITGAAANQPVINTGENYQVKNITTTTGSLLTNRGTLKIAGAVNAVAGSITNLFNDVAEGTIEMNSCNINVQTIPAGIFIKNAVKNLVISNNEPLTGVTLAGTLDVYDAVSFGPNGLVLSTGGFLTLKSMADRTARIEQLTSSNNIIGDVTVERYIPARRSWRLLSVPLNLATSNASISQLWQDGQQATTIPPPLYPENSGTLITNGTTAVNGYDKGSTNNPSLKYFDGTNWLAPLSTVIPFKTYPGYMLFIRGDRNIVIAGTNVVPNITTLKPKVPVNTGTQIINSNAMPGFQVAGNPFASAINFHSIAKTGMGDSYHLWDPALGGLAGVGAFVTFSWNSTNNNYDQTITSAGVSTLPNDGTIESGEAFMVNFTEAGSLQIKETDKVATSSSLPFGRPMVPLQMDSRLRANLGFYDTDNSRALLDGVLITYSQANCNTIDREDAEKVANVCENLGISSAGKEIAIERRQLPTTTDTIFLSLSKLKLRTYYLELTADNLTVPGLLACLQDNYTNMLIPLSLTDTNFYTFTVVNDPAAYAKDRLRIVFKIVAGGTLPVSLLHLTATQQQQNIAVQWQADYSLNVVRFEIEKSLNGKDFTKKGFVDPNQNSQYSWLDLQSVNGNNFYRIKIVNNDGSFEFSNIVKLNMNNKVPDFAVYPNPVVNRHFSVNSSNIPAGSYTLALYNIAGEKVHQQAFKITSRNTAQFIQLPGHMASGKYEAVLSGENTKTIRSISLLVQNNQ